MFDRYFPIENGTVMIDFEKAVMNAFAQILPGFSVMNCFFHLCQSVQKQIQKSFKAIYRSDKKFARASRLVVFLAFIPLPYIEDAFYELTYHIQSTYPQLMLIVNYFEKTYLGLCNEHDVRVAPQFPVMFWNHFDVILIDYDFPRTSNMVEGFHRGFKTRVNRPKPSVQEYFRAIKEQQVTTDFHVDRLGAGLTPAKKRKTSNKDLYEICSNYSTYGSNLEYLFAIARYFGHDLEGQ